jgi:hypothetical protein
MLVGAWDIDGVYRGGRGGSFLNSTRIFPPVLRVLPGGIFIIRANGLEELFERRNYRSAQPIPNSSVAAVVRAEQEGPVCADRSGPGRLERLHRLAGKPRDDLLQLGIALGKRKGRAVAGERSILRDQMSASARERCEIVGRGSEDRSSRASGFQAVPQPGAGLKTGPCRVSAAVPRDCSRAALNVITSSGPRQGSGVDALDAGLRRIGSDRHRLCCH